MSVYIGLHQKRLFTKFWAAMSHNIIRLLHSWLQEGGYDDTKVKILALVSDNNDKLTQQYILTCFFVSQAAMDATTKSKKRYCKEEMQQLPTSFELLSTPLTSKKRTNAFHKINEFFGYMLENCDPYTLLWGDDPVGADNESEDFPHLRRYADVTKDL